MNSKTQDPNLVKLVDTLWRIHNAPAEGHQADLDANVVQNLTLTQGQHCQLALLERWLAAGEHLAGWKIGMTSGASRNAMGDGIRPFGFLLGSRVKTCADQLSVKQLYRGQVENELCFLMAQPLGAGATSTSAQSAVQAVLPAFEINQKRLPPDSPAGLRVADNLSNWGIVIGEPKPASADLSAMTVTLSGEQGTIESVPSEGHIDNHYESLATLANTLASYGMRLEPGQYVITGAYGKTPFAPGLYRGDFGRQVGVVETLLVP